MGEERASAATTNTMTTYRYANGEPVWGDYAHVGDLDYFDDDDPGSEIVEEVWTLVSRRVGTVHGRMCETCRGEGSIGICSAHQTWDDGCEVCDRPLACGACNGTGEYDGERITWAPENGSDHPYRRAAENMAIHEDDGRGEA